MSVTPESSVAATATASAAPAGQVVAEARVLQELHTRHRRLVKQIANVIVGQRDVVESSLLTVFCGGHAIITGVPGLAKTLLIKTLSQALGVHSKRIQFTPDLMPTDITGTDVIEEDPASGERKLKFIPGPVFTNLLLADEINRTPPKTQAAMLQTMQEREVSVGTKTYKLPQPFHVFATQNPLDQEGTYILPEAQADRFMFSIFAGYPTRADEEAVVRNTTANQNPKVEAVMDGPTLLEMQKVVRAMPVSDEVIRYAVKLAALTRPEEAEAPKFVKDFVRCGAGPRASQFLVLGAKGRAALAGKPCADFEGVRSVAKLVLNHRVILNFNARAQKLTTMGLIDQLLAAVKE